jgi:hypothetical protein
MKMKTKDILKKLEELKELGLAGIRDFILSLDLTNEQFKILSEEKSWIVVWSITRRPDLPEDLMYKMAEDDDGDIRCDIASCPDLPNDLIIRLSCDFSWGTSFEKLSTLKSEDLENAYDLIRTSKFRGREEFEETFNYLISNFPELSEAAKLFKSIILKGKKDLK